MNFELAIQRLVDHKVEFVVIGGWAGILHGSTHVTASNAVFAFDRELQVLDLRRLIESKKATGRPKDLLVLPELEGLLEISEAEDETPD